MAATITVKRGLAAGIPSLAVGEPAFTTDTHEFYVGSSGGNVLIGPTSTGGTVTSVDVSGGTTGLTTSGGPITSSGTITLEGTLALTNGGTGATDATGARAALGLGDSATLDVGTGSGEVAAGDHTHAGVYQPANSQLDYLSAGGAVPKQVPRYEWTGIAPLYYAYVGRDLSDFALTLIDDTSASAARGTLGLGTIATQSASSVSITGGTIAGITDLAIADGGTGASDASGARTNLGLGDSATKNTGMGSGQVAPGDHNHSGVYQPQDSTLTALMGMTEADFVNFVRRPGEIQSFGFSTAPMGNWLACDGSAVSRTTYAGLFAAIGTTWGTGDGSTTFNVPDLRRRTLVGSGGTSTGTLGNTVGSKGGTETHTLSQSEMPSHTHIGLGTTTVNLTAGGTGYGLGASGNTMATGSAGSGASHNNMQPSAVVAFWIKY